MLRQALGSAALLEDVARVKDNVGGEDRVQITTRYGNSDSFSSVVLTRAAAIELLEKLFAVVHHWEE